MPKDEKQQQKETRITDRRIFTPDGDIRDEFREEIKPASPAAVQAAEKPAEPAPEKPADKPTPPPSAKEERRETRDRRRSINDKANNPGSAFTNFVEPLIAQAYMSLGLLRNPYQPEQKIDVRAARQMIDIVQLLQEKTQGNLTEDEEDFLETHLAELKLAYVQRTKSI